MKQVQSTTIIVGNSNEKQAKKRYISLFPTEVSAKKKQATDIFIPIGLLSKSYVQVIQPSRRPSRKNSSNSLFLLEFHVHKREFYMHNVAPTPAE